MVKTSKGLGPVFVLTGGLLNALRLESLFAQTHFYQGKTIRIVVGNLPGDTRSTARSRRVAEKIIE